MTDELVSRIMRANKSRGNESTEQRLVQFLRDHKVHGWRRGIKLPGSPDFVFSEKKVVVFADGCFWHGHTCRKFNPKTNIEFWLEKIKRNRVRDRKVDRQLRKEGWRVVRIWECELNRGDIAILEKIGLIGF